MGPALLNAIISWLPFFVVLGLWLFLLRQSRKTNAEVMAVNREIVTLTQTMSETLIRIEKLFEDRKA
jgi:ATP-dependent Zn protease